MKSKRPSIPKALSARVLNEFRHRCAICGEDKPHLHHIDQDPTNNTAENLIPLCPNCHLTDMHDPTSCPDQGLVALFRRTKDPHILDTRFQPIWKRMRFLRESLDGRLYAFHRTELVKFIATFRHGEFYAERVAKIAADPATYYEVFLLDNGETIEVRPPLPPELLEKVLAYRRSAIEDLCVELLRYQEWTPAHSRDRKITS